MADDINKITDKITSVTTDIEKSLQEGGKDIEAGVKKINKRFAASIERLKHSNQAVAKISLDTIETQKSTYSGAIQGRKLLKLQETLADVMEGSVERSSAEFEKLEQQFPDVDLSTYVNAQKKFMAAAEEQEKLAFREQMLNGKKKALQERQEQQTEIILGKTDQYQKLLIETEAARQQAESLAKDYAITGAAQTAKELGEANKRTKELAEKAESVKKRTMESLDIRFAGEKEALEEQGKKLDELKDKNKTVLDKQKEVKTKEEELIGSRMKEIADDSGRLGQFSDGLKTLTGFDLVGLADDVVKNVDAVGKLFGKENLFQDLMIGVGGPIESLKESMGKGMKGLKKGIGGLGKGIADTGKSMLSSAKMMGGKFIGILGKGAKMLGGFVKGLARGFMAAGKALMAAIVPFVTAAAAFVGGLLMTAGSMLLAASPYIAIGVGILAAAYMLYKAFMYLYENVEGFKGYIDTVVSFIMNIGQSLLDIFLGFKDMIVGIFTGDFDMVMEGLKGIFGGLWDLLLAPFKAIGDFFKNVFDIDIGKMLKDYARKILPGWLVKRLFGDESSEPEAAPAAAQRGLEDMDTQEVINERRAMENQKADYENIRSGRKRLTERVQNEESFKKMSEEDQAKMLDQIDKGKFDYMDAGLASNYDLEEGGMQTALGVEGMASSDELKQREGRLRAKIGRRQRVLNKRRDYVAERINPEHEGLDVEDINYMDDNFDYGDRVKTARELKEEATAGMDKGMVNTVVNQVNNNSSQNNNTTMSGTPTATDNDGAGKLAGVPAFG